MNLVPLEDRVVVKVMEQEDKTSSGIVLPDTAKEKPSKGRSWQSVLAGTMRAASCSRCR